MVPTGETKARLLELGMVRLEPGTHLPFYPASGLSGPLGGERAVHLDLGNAIVKLRLVKDEGCPLVLSRSGDRWTLDGAPAGHIEARPVRARFHAPGMAFFHLGEGCRFDCAFCSAPSGRNRGWGRKTARDWLGLVRAALEEDPATAVAFTSGMDEGQTEDDAVEFMASVVALVREGFPAVPIGVEPYATKAQSVARLKEAGSDEMKVNMETATAETFRMLCPSLDRDGLLRALEAAVPVFGRGRVCSNILIGIGEKRDDILGAVEMLASMGCVPTLRALRVNDSNRPAIAKALGGIPPTPRADELMELLSAQKRILDAHGLSPSTFRTMCHRCTACDMVPGRDG